MYSSSKLVGGARKRVNRKRSKSRQKKLSEEDYNAFLKDLAKESRTKFISSLAEHAKFKPKKKRKNKRKMVDADLTKSAHVKEDEIKNREAAIEKQLKEIQSFQTRNAAVLDVKNQDIKNKEREIEETKQRIKKEVDQLPKKDIEQLTKLLENAQIKGNLKGRKFGDTNIKRDIKKEFQKLNRTIPTIIHEEVSKLGPRKMSRTFDVGMRPVEEVNDDYEDIDEKSDEEEEEKKRKKKGEKKGTYRRQITDEDYENPIGASIDEPEIGSKEALELHFEKQKEQKIKDELGNIATQNEGTAVGHVANILNIGLDVVDKSAPEETESLTKSLTNIAKAASNLPLVNPDMSIILPQHTDASTKHDLDEFNKLFNVENFVPIKIGKITLRDKEEFNNYVGSLLHVEDSKNILKASNIDFKGVKNKAPLAEIVKSNLSDPKVKKITIALIQDKYHMSRDGFTRKK